MQDLFNQVTTSVQGAEENENPTAQQPQGESLNPIETDLLAYFAKEKEVDAEFAEKYSATKKTVHDCFRYLYELHRPKGGERVAVARKEDDWRAAKAFIMDDTKTVAPTPSAKSNAPTPKAKKKATAVALPENTGSVVVEAVKDGKSKPLTAAVVSSGKGKGEQQMKSVLDFDFDEDDLGF